MEAAELACMLAGVGMALGLGACATSSAPLPPSTAAPRETATPRASASVAPTPATAGLSACPPSRAEATLTVIARLTGAPDDLASTQAGDLWVSDESTGRLTDLSPTGAVRAVLADPRGPEGIVPLPDGRLVVAEQLADRVVVLRPPDPTPTVVLTQLRPVPGQAGLDSIALDVGRERLLIPDSAQGALRSLPLSGGPLTTLATGLGRPVDAAIGPDGFVYVAAEGTPGLWRIPVNGGSPQPAAGQVDLDEVLAVGSLLYVTELANGTVRAIDPGSGESRTLVTGIGAAQGLALLGDGRLAISDSTRGLVLALPSC